MAKRDPDEIKSLVHAKKRKIDKDYRPIWEVIEEISHSIPESELENLPHDGSINYKHYLYGLPKVEE